VRSLLLIASLWLPNCAGRVDLHPDQAVATQEYREMDLTSLDGSHFDRSQIDGKVVLYVNVASKCGLTPQYEALQALYEGRQEGGFVIVGVPCNQFGGQEPGSSDEIASFCKLNYGVEFPLLEKQDVNGKDRSSLYRYLVGSEAGAGKDINWNFEKFVVGRDGSVLHRFAPTVTPDDGELLSAIDAALGD